MSVTVIGLDLAKSVFQVHGLDADGRTVLKRRVRRHGLLAFFEELPPCLVGMEACSSAHHWARELVAPGHDVRLIPPQYAKPHVKRNKTDAADAEAICEAVCRPNMRFVPIYGEPGTADASPRALTPGAAAHRHGQRGTRSPRRVRDRRREGHPADRRPSA